MYNKTGYEKDYYGVVNSMFHHGYSTDEIVRTTNWSKIKVLDTIQRLFYKDMVEKGLV